MKSTCLLVFLFVIQIVSTAEAAAAQSQQISVNGPAPSTGIPKAAICLPGNACQTNPDPASLAFLLPLFLNGHDFSSTAVLVNSNSVPTYVDVTLRNTDGQTIARQRVNIAARNQVQIDIGDLLNLVHVHATEGSVQISPARDGTGIGVIGQMSLTYRGLSESSYLDYEPSKPSSTNSLELRAVSDESQDSPVVGITSAAGSPQNVTIRCLDGRASIFSKMVTVPPWGTVVTPACDSTKGDPLAPELANNSRLRNPNTPPQARGISLTTDAPPGSFTAFGLAPHESKNGIFFTAVPFSDPEASKTSTTVFGGLPVGSSTLLPGGYYVPNVSVANFSSSPAHVTVKFSRTTNDVPEVNNLITLVVTAGGTAFTELKGLQGDLNLQNSFEIVSDKLPGEVVDSVYSKSDTGISRVELPGKDLENSHNSGNHPWTVEDGTDSTMLLFNETASAENFTVLVSSGQAFWTKKYAVAPLATKAVNINELIEDQVKDDHGYRLPRSLKRGQANWYETRQYGGTGRLLQSNPGQHWARSFSCGEHSVIIGIDWNPYITTEFMGQTNFLGELDARVGLTEFSGCTGSYVGDTNEYDYGWSSQNTSIATISGSNTGAGPNVYGVSGGNATIEGLVWDNNGCGNGDDVQETILEPHYFVTSSYSHVTTPTLCTSGGGFGYFLDLSNYVADQNGSRIYASGIGLSETVNGVTNPSYTTPTTTNSDGSFDDTPFGGCIVATGSVCTDAPLVTHAASFGGTNYSIPTEYTGIQCTEGQEVVITGNPSGENQTITQGTVY